MSFMFRPVVAMVSVMSLLWLLSRYMGPPVDPADPGAPPAAAQAAGAGGGASWDTLAHLRLEAVADCLDRLVALDADQALAVGDMSGMPYIEAAYRRDCRRMLLDLSFRPFVVAYGERSRAAAVAFLDLEEAYVLEAVGDPFLSAEDRVAYWQVGLERAAAHLRRLSDGLEAFYTGLPQTAPSP